jgi:hypothetical protein
MQAMFQRILLPLYLGQTPTMDPEDGCRRFLKNAGVQLSKLHGITGKKTVNLNELFSHHYFS